MTRFRWKKVLQIRFYNKPLLITNLGAIFFTDTEFWVLIFLIIILGENFTDQVIFGLKFYWLAIFGSKFYWLAIF